MGYHSSLASNRGGFLSGLGRLAGRALRTVGRVAGVVPGLGTVAGLAAGAAGTVLSGRAAAAVMPGGMPVLSSAAQGRPRPGVRGAVQRLLPGGESGYIKGRRMNAGNAKAARRAIRRIKGVRKLLQSIERELPRRPCRGRSGSRGVITRREAERAFRD